MSDEIIKLKKEMSALQKKYDDMAVKNEHLILDLRKTKLDAQEERLKNERWVFQTTKKISHFKDEIAKFSHKTSMTKTEYENLIKELKELDEKIAKLKNS